MDEKIVTVENLKDYTRQLDDRFVNEKDLISKKDIDDMFNGSYTEE